MSFILFDWECQRCEAVSECPVERPAPPVLEIECESCGVTSEHKRLPPLFAKPLFDRPFSPLVKGGSFDTAGFKTAPVVPTVPGSEESARKASEILKQLPPGASALEAKDALAEAARSGPSVDDCRAHLASTAFREAEAAHNAVRKENAAKQQRARLIRAGRNVDVRHNPLPGDPKVMS